MSFTRIVTADFGPSRTGLSTVGYTLTGGTRITAGVTEAASGSGIYEAVITFPDDFNGRVLWDSGEVTPVFAVAVIYPQRLDLTQPLADTAAATVGGAYHGAWAGSFGKAVRNSTTKVLQIFGFNSQTVPLQTFDLDSGSNPTTRTPQ